MSRLSMTFAMIVVVAAIQSLAVACGENHARQEPAELPDSALSTPSHTPPAMPVVDDDADLEEAPPPVASTGGLPPAHPECPQAAPAADTRCEVPVGTARTCAWDQGGVIERCACVSRQDDAPDAELFWNCEDGVNGEGPPIDTCPEAVPPQDSACTVAASNCRYAAPGLIQCNCRVDTMRWDCEGNTGASGGE